VDSLEDYAHIKEEAETDAPRLVALLSLCRRRQRRARYTVRALLDTSPPALQNALLRAVIRKIVFDQGKSCFSTLFTIHKKNGGLSFR
jgi:hypothetical protein